MLKDQMRVRVRQAMKEGNTVEKEVLRVALGEIETIEHRQGAVSDAEAEGVVRKLIKSNDETARAADEATRATLEQENVILRSLLPQTLDVDAIIAALEGGAEAIRAASNEGQATGVAMKALKAAGAAVTGKDVSEAVRRMRT